MVVPAVVLHPKVEAEAEVEVSSRLAASTWSTPMATQAQRKLPPATASTVVMFRTPNEPPRRVDTLTKTLYAPVHDDK